MKFTAVGDYLVTRKIAPGDKDFAQIQSVLAKSDANIANLEIPISNFEGTPNILNGAWSVCARPDRLEDLKGYGFNLVNLANNHVLDYHIDGLEKTLQYLDEYGILHAGAGVNKSEAMRPAYIDLQGKRVALIGCVSTVYKAWTPGEPRGDLKGRPGPNVYPYTYDLRVTQEDFDALERILDYTHLGSMVDYAIHKGYMQPLPEGVALMGSDNLGVNYVFRASDDPGAAMVPTSSALAEIVQTIEDAKFAADYVVVNLHAHEMDGADNDAPASFIKTSARAWIDAGADAVVIQGPHITRGIEIYNGHPIFYSLGNYIFQSNTVEKTSQDFYNQYAKTESETQNQIFKRLNENPYWLPNYKDGMTSIMAQWEMDDDGKLVDITLYPIDLGYQKPFPQKGFPALSADETILDRVIKLSEPFGTVITKESFTLDDGETIVVGKIKI